MQVSKSLWQEQQSFADKKNLKLIHHMDLCRENIKLHKVYLEEELFLKQRVSWDDYFMY